MNITTSHQAMFMLYYTCNTTLHALSIRLKNSQYKYTELSTFKFCVYTLKFSSSYFQICFEFQTLNNLNFSHYSSSNPNPLEKSIILEDLYNKLLGIHIKTYKGIFGPTDNCQNGSTSIFRRFRYLSFRLDILSS